MAGLHDPQCNFGSSPAPARGAAAAPTSSDLEHRWSSPRIHWLPWADLGQPLMLLFAQALIGPAGPACPSVTQDRVRQVGICRAYQTQVEEIE